MTGRVRARRRDDASLAALVDDALAPTDLAALAHPEDWPLGAGGAPAALPPEMWDRALGDLTREILARPSRQFRARLAEMSFRLAGGAGSAPRWLGAMIEVIHAGSLIVDDVEDGSTERRGAPCLHRTFGVGPAINGGSWMYFWALQMVERLEPATPLVRDRLYRMLADTLARCHLGQALDLSARVWQLARTDVSRVVASSTTLKTGTLMELAAGLGAVVGGAPAEQEAALARFGRRLGVGLQMLDDFGNLTGGDGAKAREDLRNGTPTWPWALAAERLDGAAFGALQAAAQTVAESGDAGSAAARALAARLRAAVGFEGRRQASRYLAQALADLRAAVGDRPEIPLVTSEIRRLEVSYG
ncbi:MAG TPA: polyprenyl synthetase family protein [Polyangia bacterium]|nr:polyprenyl synthetase family protein [Polyangia bacterium]